jgi:hypothetical protein
MLRKAKPKPDKKPQHERFIETARKIGADESGKEFERAMKRIVFAKSKARQMPK